MIKRKFLARIKNAWPNEISGNDKKGFYGCQKNRVQAFASLPWQPGAALRQGRAARAGEEGSSRYRRFEVERQGRG